MTKGVGPCHFAGKDVQRCKGEADRQRAICLEDDSKGWRIECSA